MLREDISLYSAIKKQYDSDKVLNQTLFWVAPVDKIKPTIKKRSDIRIGLLASDRLFEGFQYECNVILITEENWKSIIDYGEIDFLLVESCREATTGDWYLSQTLEGESQNKLHAIINNCKETGIPTVYWNTQDSLYHEHYVDISKMFDYVFCADPRERKNLQRCNIKADILYPAIQPAIHNPFRMYKDIGALSINILFDGWADVIRNYENLDILQKLSSKGLKIIESRFRLFNNKIHDTNKLKSNVLGCVTSSQRLLALKYAKLYISSDVSLTTRTLKQWMDIEAGACRLPLLYDGEIDADDMRKDFIREFSDACELETFVENLLNDDISREKIAHETWRVVYSQHTFAHRLKVICDTIRMDHCLVEFPFVSIIIATYRKNLIDSCIEQYDLQKYPNKELILVINTNEFSTNKMKEIIGDRRDIRIFKLPSDQVESGSVNFAITASVGEYCIKMDDDDHYSPHYVWDMMLYNKAVDADVFGKNNSFFHFQDDDTTYMRKRKKSLAIVPRECMQKAHISGNSLSGRRSFFLLNKYSDKNFASTDTNFHGNIEGTEGVYVLFDDLGVIVERSADVSAHSWRETSEELKKGMTFLSRGISKKCLV